MARPTRIEFPGASYLITAHAVDGLSPLAESGARQAFMQVLALAVDRFDLSVLAFGLRPDHYGLVLTTRQANLSKTMRHVNGVFTQEFNRRTGHVGPIFQGRFKAVLVDLASHGLETCRRVDAMGAAGRKLDASKLKGSSARAHLGLEPVPPWLDGAAFDGLVLGRDAKGASDRAMAHRRYKALLETPVDAELTVRHQLFLGDERFERKAQSKSSAGVGRMPKALSLATWTKRSGSREEGMHAAYTRGGLTMTRIAEEAGLSLGAVSRLISRYESGKSA